MKQFLDMDEVACDMAAFGLIGDLAILERQLIKTPALVMENLSFIEEAYQRTAKILSAIQNLKARASVCDNTVSIGKH